MTPIEYPDEDLAWDPVSAKWVRPPSKPMPLPPQNPAVIQHFLEYLRSQPATQEKSFRSKFSSLDEQIEGIERGEVVVISGHGKNGKTLFAESWIRSLMESDPLCKALFFSFEVKTKKLLLKYLDNHNLPLFVPQTLKTMDFDWLYNHCKEAKEIHGCSLVLIDHLHFMVDMNTKQNMSLNIGAFMRRLKQDIAIGLDLAVILIAHQGQSKKGEEASIQGIRDSSFIGQECDTVIVVSRRKNYDEVELQDFANQFGEEKAKKVGERADTFLDDQYSAGLAVVSVEVARRSGAFGFKKLFKKVGDFMEEV